MQVAKTQAFDKRVQLYMAKALQSQVHRGARYQHVKRVIFLGFTNHILFPSEKVYKSVHTTRPTGSDRVYLEHMRYTFVELPKFVQACANKTPTQLSLEEKFYYFLHTAHCVTPQQRKALIDAEAIFRMAFEALDCANWTAEELRRYEAIEKAILDNLSAEDQRMLDAKQEGRKEGEQVGIEKGRKEGEQVGLQKGKAAGRKEGEQVGLQKGRKAEKLALARKLMAKGMDEDMIQELTGLSVSELAGL